LKEEEEEEGEDNDKLKEDSSMTPAICEPYTYCMRLVANAC